MGGEKALAAMIGTMCQAVENEYGVIVTRLFRVFKPAGGKCTVVVLCSLKKIGALFFCICKSLVHRKNILSGIQFSKNEPPNVRKAHAHIQIIFPPDHFSKHT